jgi:hypothetical protein
MKAKIPLLIAASLFLATVSKAQYGREYADNHLTIQGQVVIPGPAVVGYGYNNAYRERYEENRDRRDYDYTRFADQKDWRAAEYERYCRDHRDYRMNRSDFYRDRCGYQQVRYCAPKRVIVYRY